MPKQGHTIDAVRLLCLLLVTLVVLACLIRAFRSVLVHESVCFVSRVSFFNFQQFLGSGTLPESTFVTTWFGDKCPACWMC